MWASEAGNRRALSALANELHDRFPPLGVKEVYITAVYIAAVYMV